MNATDCVSGRVDVFFECVTDLLHIPFVVKLLSRPQTRRMLLTASRPLFIPQDFLGACEFALSEVVTAPGSKLVCTLRDRHGADRSSRAVLLAEEASNSKENYRYVGSSAR